MGITAKSVVFDCGSTWSGDPNGDAGIRSIDFYLAGSLVTLTETDFTAYGTFYSPYYPRLAFITALSKTGTWGGTTWLLYPSGGNLRLTIVFNNPQEFDTIVINNLHNSGLNTASGIKDLVITASDDAITDTTYNAAISNATALFDGELRQHVVSNVEDPETVWKYSDPLLWTWKNLAQPPALVLDWDNKESVVFDTSNNVQVWEDQSGNSNHATQTTEAYRPSHHADGCYSDSTSSYKYLTWPAITTLTAVWVTKSQDGTGDYRHIASSWHGESAASGMMFSNSYTDVSIKNGAARLNGSPLAVLSVPRFTTQSLLVMSPTSGVLTANTGSGGGFPARCYYGQHRKILLFDYTLSGEEIEKLEGSLAWECGLEASLPADHPYKDAAPTLALFDPTLIPDSQKLVLTLDSSQITTDQTDFPLTVVLDNTDPLHEALFTDLGSNSKKLSIETDVTTGGSITAKSVVFDIADSYGTLYIAVRSIEFLLNSVVIPMTSGFTAYATSNYNASYLPANAFNTSLSKIGSYTDNEWLTATYTNQRLIIVFDNPLEFDEIIINNSHLSGTWTTNGINNVVITASTDAITSTVYNTLIANSTVLFNGVIAQHSAVDAVDDQTYYENVDVPTTVLTQLPIEIEYWGSATQVEKLRTSVTTTDQSSYYASTPASLCFDGLVGAGNYWITDTGIPVPHWMSWGYAAILERPLSKYSLQCNSIPEPSRMPKDWTLSGSLDNSNWVVIDTVVEETAWTASEVREYIPDDVTTAYRYYKITITANNGDAYTIIAEIGVFYTEPAKAVLHTKVPIYSASADTELTLSYDSSRVDNTKYVGDTGSTPAQLVWDSNFAAVYHMAQADILNSANSLLTGTNTGTSDAGETPDLGRDFGSAANFYYIDVADHVDLKPSLLTLEISFVIRNLSVNGILATKRYAWSTAPYNSYILYYDSDALVFQIGCTDNSQISVPTSSCTNGQKHYVAGSWDGSAAKIFLDGIIENTQSVAGKTINYSTLPLRLGATSTTNINVFDGVEYEVRISNIARSEDWIKLTNLSLTDQLVTFSEVTVETEINGASSTSLDSISTSQSGVVNIIGASSNTLEPAQNLGVATLIDSAIGTSVLTLDSITSLHEGIVVNKVFGASTTELDSINSLHEGIVVNKVFGASTTELDSISTTYVTTIYDRIHTFSPIVYSISYASSVSSSFEVLGEFEVAHISEYSILPHDEIEVEFESVYALTSSGILGITERMLGVWDAWDSSHDDRHIYLHLYNEIISERNVAYTRYYQVASNKNTFVSREMLQSDRSIIIAYYTEYTSQKTLFTSCLDTQLSNRYAQTYGFETHLSEKSTLCAQVLSTGSERSCAFLSVYNSYRSIFYKVWHQSERWIGTYAKERSVYTDQRYAYVEITQNKFESIRLMYTEVCSLSYELLINPAYVMYPVVIDNTDVTLFENEEVINESTTFTNIPINISSVSNDLILVSTNTEQDIVYASASSLTRLEFTRVEDTDTYIYTGELITTKDTAFIKVNLSITNIEFFNTTDEYINYLRSIGYLKVEIAGKEMSTYDATVIDVPALTKIPIVIQAHSSVLENKNVNVLLKWAYPYSYLIVNKVMLVGVMAY